MSAIVNLASNRDLIEHHNDQGLLVDASRPPTTSLVVDSSDYNSRQDYLNFTVLLNETAQKAKKISVFKVLMGCIPNVNYNNRSTTVKHEIYGSFTFNLICGFYTPTTFVNMFNSQIQAKLTADGHTDVIVLSYDSNSRTFKITSNTGKKIDFIDSCDFIKYGDNLHNFKGIPQASNPSKTSVNSGIALMLYTKYISLHSSVISSKSAAGFSKASNGISQSDLIAVLSCEDHDIMDTRYIKEMFSDSQIIITLLQSNLQKLSNQIDFRFLDEYGRPLDNAFKYMGSSADIDGAPQALIYLELVY